MAFLTRLKEEKEKLDLQIQKSQIEIADLIQVIEDTEDQKTKQKREYQKEIAKIGKLIEQQKGGKYNPNECKIKQLKIQLRYHKIKKKIKNILQSKSKSEYTFWGG